MSTKPELRYEIVVQDEVVARCAMFIDAMAIVVRYERNPDYDGWPLYIYKESNSAPVYLGSGGSKTGTVVPFRRT